MACYNSQDCSRYPKKGGYLELFSTALKEWGHLVSPQYHADLLPSPKPVAVYTQSPYYPPTHKAGIHNTSVVVCNHYLVQAVIGRFLAVKT